ncbi:MAG: hypothetical protein PUD59_01765 [bacterium]|nr:hypothetical protein [bacterium]
MKKILVLLGVVLVVLLVIVIFRKNTNIFGNNSLKNYSDKTVISDTTTGYTLDLRIYGTINNKKINNIIRVSNYKNTDKDITVNKLSGEKEEVYKYLVKNGKYYEVKDEKTTEVKSIIYEDTDIYLTGIDSIKNVNQQENQTIGEETYNVYKGTVSKDVVNSIIEKTDLSYKAVNDAEIEVWLTSDNRVYRVYYRFDELTIYASYFGYNNAREVDLNNKTA